MLQKLPLDLSTFSSLREQQYLYIDKTEYAHKMITGGHRFFLARPRRFGKSLFVSTLKEILEGNKELFEGLWIARSDYQWKPHGVIALDISALGIKDPGTFKQGMCTALMEIANAYSLQITTEFDNPALLLRNIALELHKRFGHVAILVDEYDNPILRALNDPERAGAIRDEIRTFFTVIKGLDSYIDFAFITGISSFVRAGLFSGINNLRILTLDEHYAGVCGYTEEEVDSSFSAHIASWAEKEGCTYDELRKKIKEWYNGYHFSETSPSVYNPFSLMNALEAKKFKNYWFQSGTPTFLVEILRKEYKSFDPEYLEATDDLLQSSFEVNSIPLLALMFQAGYLTITGYEDAVQLYTLDYPNHEVKTAFQKYLLESLDRMSVV
jgi:hypothetical protein